MGLRPARVYRNMDNKRPYTRRAITVHKKNFIKGVKGSKLRLFEMGTKKKYALCLFLYSKKNVQIRHNALEAARVASTSYIKKKANFFFLKMLVYPHHILREHAQAAIAQADRFYQGMAHPFGKPKSTAARVKTTQPIIKLYVDKDKLDDAKIALKRAGMKFPTGCKIKICEE
ncbi:MAG: 50S ribosomal protein L16 [Candidatus Aenigmarchaeota archaeon ex4484_52]|nr:MAG: 50S ribosomal protein L16 [Candidatus Aenigmarchaeota archaeon ex4484_52]